MPEVVLVLAAGGIGSASRHFGDSFAWGTMIVNLLGCLLVGFLAGLADRAVLSRTLRILLVTGVLGGFTTFSSFSFESVRMILGGFPARGMANLGINVVLGFGLTAAGEAALDPSRRPRYPCSVMKSRATTTSGGLFSYYPPPFGNR